MKIIPLSEGTFTIDSSKVFVPFSLQYDKLENRNRGSLLVEIQPFAVITSKDIILLDTGLGFFINGKLQIHQNLLANGIKPEEITKVLLTHLHKDHAGGVSIKDKLGHYSLAFPNATYYVPKVELDYAYDAGFPSYMTDEINILVNQPKAVLFEDSGKIDDYIFYEVVGGHSPYHAVYWIKENNETIFFGGDNAPQLQQMKSRFMAKYDYHGKKSMELRQQWWEKGQNEKWTFLFYHDTKTPSYSNLENGLP